MGHPFLALTALIGIWAIRLSSFLFTRVKRVGKDGRFDSLKPLYLLLLTWMLQGLWVFMCTYPALIALASPTDNEIIYLGIGAFVWLLGWGYEVVADNQKTSFNKDPKNAGKFINIGVEAIASSQLCWRVGLVDRNHHYCGSCLSRFTMACTHHARICLLVTQ